MLNRYIIVDDFYNNPDELVKTALESLREDDSPSGNYAGVMTTKYFLGENLRNVFQKLTLEPSVNSSTNANGRLRFTRAKDTFKFHIHYDVDMKTKWAGVVYLSKNHPKTIQKPMAPASGGIYARVWKWRPIPLRVLPNTVGRTFMT